MINKWALGLARAVAIHSLWPDYIKVMARLSDHQQAAREGVFRGENKTKPCYQAIMKNARKLCPYRWGKPYRNRRTTHRLRCFNLLMKDLHRRNHGISPIKLVPRIWRQQGQVFITCMGHFEVNYYTTNFKTMIGNAIAYLVPTTEVRQFSISEKAVRVVP
jgi:hypothetical protein